MACSSGCPTPGRHESFGACLRAKSLQVGDPEARQQRQGMEHQINEYVDARMSGMQPKTVFKKDVDFARKASDALGTPYRADKD